MRWAAEFQALISGAVSIDHPWALALALFGALILLGYALLRGPPRIRVPATPQGGPQDGLRGRLSALLRIEPSWWLSVTARVGALALVALALAGPVALIPKNPIGGSGIDLIIALDASGSMNALDGLIDGRRVTRLELAKRVVAEFIGQRDGDRLGLVVFGQRAFTQCPLTVDHRLLLAALERVEVGIAGDATAIGEAIGLSTRRFPDKAGRRSPDKAETGFPDTEGVRGERVVLLLTDGRHNSGQLGPETAAQIAKLHEIRIHAVGIGGTGVVPFARNTPGEPLRFESVDLDSDTLRAVAQNTGGQFFHARRPRDLVRVAEVIDRIEGRPQRGEPQLQRASLTPWAVGAALLLLAVEILASWGVLRRLP